MLSHEPGFTLSSMSDKEREGGGLAVLVLASSLVLLMMCGGGGVWLFVRNAQRQREFLQEEMMVRAEAAAQARAEELEVAERVQAAIETPFRAAGP